MSAQHDARCARHKAEKGRHKARGTGHKERPENRVCFQLVVCNWQELERPEVKGATFASGFLYYMAF